MPQVQTLEAVPGEVKQETGSNDASVSRVHFGFYWTHERQIMTVTRDIDDGEIRGLIGATKPGIRGREVCIVIVQPSAGTFNMPTSHQ